MLLDTVKYSKLNNINNRIKTYTYIFRLNFDQGERAPFCAQLNLCLLKCGSCEPRPSFIVIFMISVPPYFKCISDHHNTFRV